MSKEKSIAELNDEIKFCETCTNRVELPRHRAKCKIGGQSLRYYDRSCDRYEEIPSEEFEWDEELKAYVKK